LINLRYSSIAHRHASQRSIIAWKYVEAFAGSDIETTPPATNTQIQESGRTFARTVDQMPCDDVLAEIDAKVDMEQLEAVLMAEGVKKFADPQKALLALIARKRSELGAAIAS
jgi:transaldolase